MFHKLHTLRLCPQPVPSSLWNRTDCCWLSKYTCMQTYSRNQRSYFHVFSFVIVPFIYGVLYLCFFCQIPIPSYVNSIKNRGQGILDGEPTFSGDACDCVCKCNWLRGYVKGKTHAQKKHINNFPTTSSASTNTWNKRKTMTNKQFVGHDVGTCILDSMRIRPAHRLH